MYALISESQSSAVLGDDFNNKKLARSCSLLGLCAQTEYRTLPSLLDQYLFDSFDHQQQTRNKWLTLQSHEALVAVFYILILTSLCS